MDRIFIILFRWGIGLFSRYRSSALGWKPQKETGLTFNHALKRMVKMEIFIFLRIL
jgi:hypothetical protein